jgi:transposase-like protein
MSSRIRDISCRLSKWRQVGQEGSVVAGEKPSLTTEQAEFRRLQKELKEAQLKPDMASLATLI